MGTWCETMVPGTGPAVLDLEGSESKVYNSIRMTNLLLTINQAAKLLNLSPQTVYRKVGRGEIPVIRLGKTIRVERDRLTESSFVDNLPSDHRTELSSERGNTIPGFLYELFWEYDPATLQPDDQIVIERILELGDLAAVQWLLRTVSKTELLSFLDRMGERRLSPRSVSYWNLLLR